MVKNLLVLKNKILQTKYLPIFVTVVLFIVLCAFGAFKYTGFFRLQTFLNLLIDNSFLLITAIGITFVLITGGIDISVGAVIAFVCMLSAYLLENKGWNPWVVIMLMLIIGCIFGTIMGVLVTKFKIQPFIATLAGMFLARGLCYLVSIDTITITNETYAKISQARIKIGNGFISWSVVIALIVLVLAIYILQYTKFGRTIYAIGGNEQSARLMGLPVDRTKILVYTLSGFCSALAGVVFSFYMLSGYGQHTVGLEMDAIASAVIGGIMLTGGVGYVFGTLLGVLTQGVIQTIITFEGTLSSWWTKIVVAALLCLFIILQRVFIIIKDRKA
ncbi:galactofuranose ABC transporter, permease protein YjfF [Clostridium sp. DSM 100503]|uniref:galactofuranose ABC transporter, permease protein YjfF n=1 Tax=unclassified Clostridium TaxID=2614128 RepID=UPI002149B478|nr:galactofuranose ABC transporter, permease protein YjfF [Clostridium sp. DSM 100503]MCR1951931.1 sugar ABC transporter permease YjfF [Clostridium sp. DSM 100503]